MPESKHYFIGIDVGGTSVKEGLFDETGKLLGKVSVPTPPLINEEGYAAVVSGIDALCGEAGILAPFIRGIGLAVPCPVPANGDIKIQANIELNAPGLKAALEGRCPNATVKYGNDANAAAMGELWQGSAKGAQSMVMVTIGTGVGGGVVVNGDVVEGVAGAAGEIGHMCLNPAETRTCGCGGHGCLEQYASATGVVSNYLIECEKRGAKPVELSGPSDSRTVFQLCREGDEVAWAAVEVMTDYLGRALALVSGIIDPEAFVIGGGASASADVYLEKLVQKYQKYVLPVSANTPIEVASLGNDAGIIGAAYIALRASAVTEL